MNKRKPSEQEIPKLWACPFAKLDKKRYSEQNLEEKEYRKCQSATLAKISTVKQHLRRTHCEPQFYCGKCYERFKTKPLLIQHNREECATSLPRYKGKLTDEEYAPLTKYLPNTADSWYYIFKVISKDARPPPSPYVSDDSAAATSDFVKMLRLFGPTALLGILRLKLRQDPQCLQIPASLRVSIEETFELAFPSYLQQMRSLLDGDEREINASATDHSNSTHSVIDNGEIPCRPSPIPVSGLDDSSAPATWVDNFSLVDFGFREVPASLFNSFGADEPFDFIFGC